MSIFSKLFKKKIYQGENVYLKENYRVDEKSAYDGVATIYYDIYRISDNAKVGRTDLRLTVEGEMYYYGHVGYHILKEYRGNNYSYFACKILFKIAHDEFNLSELVITCSPENIASYKVLEKLGGKLIEIVDVPSSHTLYRLGETKKCVFKYIIN